ncbi:MAG TPA: porin family protein [Bacteroidales bacterium]|nr:porin family protein [Bacteroidales bacterium]
MKQKLFFICVMIFTLNSLYAQRAGIRAGLNLAHANYSVDGLGITTSNLPRYHVGLTGELPVWRSLYLNSGISYTIKGVSLSFLGSDIDFPVSYLEVPVNFVYKYDLGLARVFGMAGPYVDYGLKARSTKGGDVNEIEFGSNDDQIKRIDYGFNFGTGIEFDNFSFAVAYGLGIPNLSNVTEETMKNGVLSFTIACFLINVRK